MQDDFKSRYACPRCGAKLNIKSGNCPKCGFIGPMQHKGIRLRATNAAGKAVTVDPPTVQQDTAHQKPSKTQGAVPQYTCPRCGAKANKAYGSCPNHRSCGYVGTMKTSAITKPKTK